MTYLDINLTRDFLVSYPDIDTSHTDNPCHSLQTQFRKFHNIQCLKAKNIVFSILYIILAF